MKTQELEVVSTRVAKTLKENVEGRDIFYQYETNDQNPKPMLVNFSTQGQGGKSLSGTYTQEGNFSLNGNGVNQVEDLDILKPVLSRILEIINSNNEI